MFRGFQCFLAVSSLAGVSKTIHFECSVHRLDRIFLQPCVYRKSSSRLKHNKQEKKHRKTKWPPKQSLPQAKVPEELRLIYLDRKKLLQYAPTLGEKLSLENYEKKFTTLLHLEEIQQETNLRTFDLKNVKFRYDGKYFYLYVPAIAAGSLSVSPEDQVIVTHSTSKVLSRQLATVYKESNGYLQLEFKREFHEQYDQDLPEWDVRFIFNRISLRRCHNALRSCEKLGTSVLFPEETRLQPPCHMMSSELFDQNLNKQQQRAVRQILAGESRPTPYIVFGPPGTGKTKTIVEAILQIYTKLPWSRVLVCAPSNSAVNLLAQKLHESGHMNPGIMARHFAVKRLEDTEGIPECVRPYSRVIDNINTAFKYQIVLTTCNSAGALYSLKLPEGHYTHVFIDEAGQATEPDALIPLTLVSSIDGQIILSGDPHQLGPVVLSNSAQEFGLDVSLLERLMQLPIYSRDTEKFSEYGCYNPLLVTKLVNNFRSHASILQSSSEMFYHRELQAEGATTTTHRLCEWSELPVKGIPLIFHSIKGTEQVGYHKPSRFNIEEATTVVEYIKKMFDTIEDLKVEDIGIITPYRLQVETIQDMVANKLYKKIDVGTVEFFQGQERRVIIISAVRSSEETDGSDQSILGFLENPRRLNVALTRAQALLIVIGNPIILSRNKFWKAFIDYCKSEGVYLDDSMDFKEASAIEMEE